MGPVLAHLDFGTVETGAGTPSSSLTQALLRCGLTDRRSKTAELVLRAIPSRISGSPGACVRARIVLIEENEIGIQAADLVG
jgi:hypothetical protein